MNPILNDILTTLGGVGVILSGLFVYFGKLQLEKYKKSLEKSNLKLKTLLDQGVHVTKSRFDQVPADKTKDEVKLDRLTKFAKANNEFVTLLNQYTPFYSSEVDESLKVINKVCRHEAIDYELLNPHDKDYWEKQRENQDKLLAEIDNCGQLIKKRIDSLSVVGTAP
ncbi:hypothetical protein AUR67_09120 [Pseudoalteromonas sp. XI10]|uniref:hypothetical protein n=1 Tax=Pseudoalteromonas sp. XI10 TaxID=1766621 RepID=UPI0007337527|nr:hypothetical protein [Pseudoalteromonas sp. XI10]KTG20988.1 hypothetical protein AUR67_09120 [Pseudoalteromonas sp. XI10]